MNKPTRNCMDNELSFFNSVLTLFKYNQAYTTMQSQQMLICGLRIDIEVDWYHTS